MAKSRCKRGSRKCITGCVGKQAYRKIKKCADQACHNKTAKRVRRVATPVKSSYSLRSRGTKK